MAGPECSLPSTTAPASVSAATPPAPATASRRSSQCARASCATSAESKRTWPRGLSLRHDHGSNYLSRDFQDEIAFLGIESSPSFVRQPEGNGVAERFIRTLKENFLWVHTFDTIEELRRGLQEFVAHYNATWLVARHGYRTPNQVRAEQRGLAQCPPANLPLAA